MQVRPQMYQSYCELTSSTYDFSINGVRIRCLNKDNSAVTRYLHTAGDGFVAVYDLPMMKTLHWNSGCHAKKPGMRPSRSHVSKPLPFAISERLVFVNGVLNSYTDSPALTTLRRLVFHRCNQISGGYLIPAFQSLRDRIGADRFDLEVESVACPYIRRIYQMKIEDLGVRVKADNETEDRIADAKNAGKDWWTRHPEIVEDLGLQDDDWKWEEAREEYPWWISDIRSLDPTDSWVF